MLSVKLFLYLAALYVGVTGWTAAMHPQKKPAKYEHLDGCYLPEYDRIMEYGEIFYPINHECDQYICSDTGDITINGCIKILPSPNCELVEGNLSLPYPKCCQPLRCVGNDGSEFIDDPY